MPTATKVKQVEKMKERYQSASGVIFTEYSGLSVPAMQRLRRDLKEKGAEISVVKNTLFKLAVGEDAEKFPDGMISGPTAITYVFDDEASVAKALYDFMKVNKTFVVKGAYLDGTIYDSDQMEALSKLPPKDVLIAQVIGTIAAPLSNLVGVIEAIYATPIRTIGAVADKAAEESPIEEAAAPEAPAEEAPAPEASAEAAAPEAPAEEAPAPEASAEEAAPEAPAEEASASEAPAEEATAAPESEPTAEAPAEATTDKPEDTQE